MRITHNRYVMPHLYFLRNKNQDRLELKFFLKNSSLITLVLNILNYKILECDELKPQLITPYLTDCQNVNGACDE